MFRHLYMISHHLKECLHVAFFTAFFWVAWDLMEALKNEAFNARNGFGTHSVCFS